MKRSGLCLKECGTGGRALRGVSPGALLHLAIASVGMQVTL